MSNYKYTDEIEARMKELAAGGVTEEVIQALESETGFPRRSITAKLRSLDFSVPTKKEEPVFSKEETEALRSFLETNNGNLTAAEVASQFMGGKFTDRQIRGKALALELTDNLKKTPPKEKVKSYSADEEALITKLTGEGKFLEEIAAALNKPLNSVRGKLLSMDLKAPQKNKKAPAVGGSYPGLEEIAGDMTVAELVAHYNEGNEGAPKTERGVKTALSRRGVDAKDYTSKKSAPAA